MEQNLNYKYERLKEIISDLGHVMIAYSGGVDSTLLLKVAKDVLGDFVVAVTSSSETYPSRELEDSENYAKQIGVKHILIHTSELEIAGFADNPPDRCYFCKNELFTKLKEIADELSIKYILDGANYDDKNDHRPGMRAAREFGIVSPLKEAGFTKEDIRELSKQLDLPTWDKPSFACLSSRFPYGTKITQEKLKTIDEAEDFIRNLGFRELRVRHHETIARIEIPKSEFEYFLNHSDTISKRLKELGFLYITLDLEGFRTGSMNMTLRDEELCKDIE